MGGEVILKIPKKQVAKAKKIIAKCFEKAKGDMILLSLGPAVTKWEKEKPEERRPDCWIQWNRNELQFGYTFGDGGCSSQWAKALALEFCHVIRPEAAGWDSIGYVDDLEKDFLASFPFKLDIRNSLKLIKMKGVTKEYKKIYKEELKDFRLRSSAYEDEAVRIFGGAKNE